MRARQDPEARATRCWFPAGSHRSSFDGLSRSRGGFLPAKGMTVPGKISVHSVKLMIDWNCSSWLSQFGNTSIVPCPTRNRTCFSANRCIPEMLCDLDWCNMSIRPPCDFIAMIMQLLMVLATQRHGKFVADLAPKRPRLGKLQMMRVARRALANETGLC